MRSRLSSLVLLTLLTALVAAKGNADVSVAAAWESWQQNNAIDAEMHFQKALEADPANLRANVGLAYLYQNNQDYDKAWQHYRKVLKHPDGRAYMFAGLNSGRMALVRNDSTSGLIDAFKQMSDNATKNDMLTAMAHQSVGDHYRSKGNIAKSDAYYARSKALRNWSVIGPFENVSASGFNKVFAPEESFNPNKQYVVKNGAPAKWFTIDKTRPDGWIDFRRYFSVTDAVFYGNSFIQSPKKQKVQLRIGTSGSLKAFLNDETVIAYEDENNNDLDTYIVETELQKGWNRLLIKVGYSEISQCNFMVRITDTKEQDLNLPISIEKKSYKKRPGASIKPIENFAEVFFRAKVKENPDHLENYLLLADTYLRNDKAIEGELVLRDALQKSPDFALLYLQLLEAYRRGEKDDDVATALEKATALDPDGIVSLVYKYEQALENSQIDQAERLLAKLEPSITGKPAMYQMLIGLYSNKREIEKLIATSKEAYEKYPDNWQFASMEANISIQTTRTYGRAIEIYEDYLKKNYSATVLSTLASTYLKGSDVDSWESYYRKIIELDETARGSYYQMAATFISLQKYPEAKAMLKEALALCPGNSVYWSKLGEVQRTLEELEAAEKSYETALQFDPADYDAREVLRTLRDQPAVISYFDSVDVTKVIAEAPSANEVENDAIVLLDDVRRVVYERGASEVYQDYLVKVFNKRGIDSWKEYWINFNGYTESLVVEKAAVVKPDGSEIKADVSGNHVVFKSLEEDDIIYLKWRVKNYYSGKLAGHFWDQFSFNGFYPIKKSRYALLVPKSIEFNQSVQNATLKPSKKKTSDGTLYLWESNNEPAMEYEYGMPIYEDIAKTLFVSSIDDWKYIVDWYSDIAQSKARSTYEIKEQVQQLFAGKSALSDDEKIEIVYNFITENIRYSSVSFRQSGLIPQTARDVLVTRIGDCKDVTTLAIAMLREVGIESYYVLINTKDEGRNEAVLPSIAFNHCIVGVETDRGTQFLDLTANNYPYRSVPEMDREGFSLLIKKGSTKPFHLDPTGFLQREVNRDSQMKMASDNTISLVKHSSKSASLAASMRASYRDQAHSERERVLAEILTRSYNSVRLESLEFENLDALNEPINYTYTFTVEDYVNEVGKFKFLKVPWADAAEADRALSYETRQYAYDYLPGVDVERESIEIELPAGYEPLELGENINISSSVADYQLSFSYKDGVIRGERILTNKKDRVQPEEYEAFRRFYRRVLKEDGRFILLRQVLQN
ncbi:MAG: DUF3857 domain-containing protein [Calditrichia bacterium]